MSVDKLVKASEYFYAQTKRAGKDGAMYHGSPRALQELLPDPGGLRTMNGLGIWLTSDPEAASFYGEYLYEVRLPEAKFYSAKGDDLERAVYDKVLATEFGITARWPEARNDLLFNVEYLKAWREKMKRAGYLGIVWKNSFIDRDPESGETAHDIYLVFTDRLPVTRR